ncbi:MAG TPA: hypothetical protein VN687_08605, partial [Blastocatellia bacterium]|nr:hypothetical protein [Blastocatellia bacterium]
VLTVDVPAENLVTTPRELDFGELTVESAGQTLRRLGVRKLVGSFEIKSISSTLPFLKFEKVVIVPGSNYLIRVTIDVAKPLKTGAQQGVIVVETDGGKRLEVPIKLKLLGQ